ncbi:ubiquitin carboxyl-terminal hydrolase 47-like isoform X2 [Salminus brasiliensis]|uniref:ubiquitin carboxyl-terminal hydrolase 47-like isoform X2 n=1 Tax=Salminus brasiliensis TaxID=930266 RepID=UPI003B838119
MGSCSSVNRNPAAKPHAQKTRHEDMRYNGLKNQGSTCYLNTVLQCLYMTKDFRTAVESFKQGPKDSSQGSVDLLLQLQTLFGTLKVARGTTRGITRSLRIRNVHEQQDAVEYYQKILKTVGPPVSQVFEGKISNNSKCLKGHIFQEKCSFITIPLAIEVGHNEVFNVNEGLKAFFKPSTLDEDNWLYCDQCDQKTESETWNKIEEIPTVLTLHLKRFDFDFMQMKHVKNHCAMDIPLSLQIKDYEYDLYAVINHKGDRSGGHYNAVIKSFEDDQWYCFDDSSVTKDSNGSLQMSRFAYLLMYRQRAESRQRSSVLCKLLQSRALWICLFSSICFFLYVSKPARRV